ncbi:MAG: putative Protocatechuate 3,4-dioxygenase [Phenylobacterium sp.]|jgi:protocatechuate 3,4-dioxygenase beta subunit|nr:putative Protocatechuate 3,4-dioxygenase [Phenylobacterium sp.]
MALSRRLILAQTVAGLLMARPAGAAALLTPTPQETLGPFFPVRPRLERDADLTRIAGRPGRAAGQIIEVSGRVLTREARPIAGAVLKIWQANAAGRYDHPDDDNPAPLDPNFQGYAELVTGADGSYRILTVKPAAYPDAVSGTLRTPHIHFDVTGHDDRAVAQMYFPGEPLNDKDVLMRSMATRSRDPSLTIAARAAPRDGGVAAFTWDIVLRGR